MIGFKSFKQLTHKFWLMVANMPMPGHWRWRFYKRAGINFVHDGNHEGRTFRFIGQDVHFDSVYPELITIGNYCQITGGTVLLTHYLDVSDKWNHWKKGNITIGDHVFIGMNTIITKPVTIGNGAVIGAGSVVTKDIPNGEIWGGNPARFIKKRDGWD